MGVVADSRIAAPRPGRQRDNASKYVGRDPCPGLASAARVVHADDLPVDDPAGFGIVGMHQDRLGPRAVGICESALHLAVQLVTWLWRDQVQRGLRCRRPQPFVGR